MKKTIKTKLFCLIETEGTKCGGELLVKEVVTNVMECTFTFYCECVKCHNLSMFEYTFTDFIELSTMLFIVTDKKLHIKRTTEIFEGMGLDELFLFLDTLSAKEQDNISHWTINVKIVGVNEGL